MTYSEIDIDLSQAAQAAVDFSPATTAQEIAQNVRTILATRKGSVPHDRDLGVDWGIVDTPTPVTRARLQSEIIRALQRDEPRATLVSMEPSAGNDVARPKIRIGING